MAGGTGGHIYPALAVAEYLTSKGLNIIWLGTEAGMESRVIPKHGYPLVKINVTGMRGKGFVRFLSAPVMLIRALLQALTAMVQIKPAAVLGMGGFVSGPGGLAAWIMGVPLYIHEQNAIAGLTNRILSPLAKLTMQGFPGAFRKNNRVRTTGNPVRKELLNIRSPEVRLAEHNMDVMNVLVLGGSLGAKNLNEILPQAMVCLSNNVRLEIWHQTGEKHIEATKSLYQQVTNRTDIRIHPYIEDMAEAYEWADLVVCRAGALTIAELCVAGVASVLVPYPHAVDDHQKANGRYMVEAGCAIMNDESSLDGKTLAYILTELYQSRGRLIDMARKAHDLAIPHATEAVGNLCLESIYA